MRVWCGFVCLGLAACASGGGDSSGGGRGVQIGDGTAGASGDMGGAGTLGDPGMTGMGAGMGGTSGGGMLTPIEKTIMEGEECDLVTQQADNGKQPVDIIWAIDSSPSMAFVIGAMEMEMNKLVDTVTAADIDVHIVLISGKWNEDLFNNPVVGDPVICVQAPTGSGNCNDDTNLPLYHHVDDECGADGCWVGSHNALSRLIGTYPYYMSDLRPDSLKYFGAMTDDTAGDTNDYAGQAAQFTADVAALDPGSFDEWKFFGIIKSGAGGAYQMLADQTGGMTGEIGLGAQDYTELYNMLAVTITNEVKLACEWEIPAIEGGAAGDFDKYKTNFSYTPGDGSVPPDVFHVSEVGACGMEHGWYYDNNDSPKKVVVCPKTCATVQPDLMGKIDILFGCTTIERPD